MTRKPADAGPGTMPAHDKTAEQALIGAAILDPTVPDRVTVTATDFYRPQHETLWTILGGLNGSNPDRAVGLLDALRSGGGLKPGYLDGPYIQECVAACTTPHAAGQYAAIITRHARHRRARQAVQRAAQRIDNTDPEDLAAAVYEAMADLEAVATDVPNRVDATTWEPLDLDPVLRGGELDPAPTLLPRSDNIHLVYAGAVHSLSGEPGSGKTWIALYAATHVLADGGRVLFVDFEDRAARVVSRLLALGAKPEHIRDQFTYIRPHRPLDDAARVHLEHAANRATLAIIDGVTEAMTLHGLDLSANPDVATFYALLPRWIADRGPAVILIDHVIKDADHQGRWAIGGQHKLAGLDGVAYLVKAVEPFGRCKRGTARVAIAKDRAGFVEEHALGRTAAEFHLDATNPHIIIATLDPAEAMPTGDQGAERPTILMEKVCRYLEAHPDITGGEVDKAKLGKIAYVRQALRQLVTEGYVEVQDGPRNAKYHRVIHPFRRVEEDLA